MLLDLRRLLDMFYDENMGRLMIYNMEVIEKRILCNLYFILYKLIKWIFLYIFFFDELIFIFFCFDLICVYIF